MSRQLRHSFLVALAAVALLGCATTDAATVGTPVDDDAFAPTPFSADQIRRATHDGRQYVFDMTVKGKPTGRRIMTFSNVNAEGATVSSHNTDLEGIAVGAVMSNQVSWEDLRKHALYPKEGTRVSEEKVTVGAGTFDCKHYVVITRDKEGAETISRVWFATSLPGAPVRIEVTRNGEPVIGMSLAKHRASDAESDGSE